MGVVGLGAMRRGVGTLRVFGSEYLLVLGTPPALGRSTCEERERAADFPEKELIGGEIWWR